MDQDKIHIYLMPGMAASPLIFEHIKLSENRFQIHFLKWFMPNAEEPISDYALRMCAYIKHKDSVLLGVSFGGLLVQEMSKHINFRKIIIVSSVKSMNELPKRMIIAKLTRAYRLVPMRLVGSINILERYIYKGILPKRIELYKKYLSVKDTKYLNWALKEMVCWSKDKPDPEVIHIHGNKDKVFPIRNIDNCIVLEGATHVAIISKCKWFNENLPKIILGE